MQLHIRHETHYRYDEPVKHSTQVLRLTPRRETWQRTLSWQIAAPGRRTAQVDAHGNVIHLLTLDDPHREVRIVVDGVVETDDIGLQTFADEGVLSPLAYLGETVLTRADEALRRFATGFRSGDTPDPESLMALAGSICDRIDYVQGATDVSDPAASVFVRGKGVCQDHAHVFIACCRAIGIPVRYVSGYLYTGAGSRPEMADHFASHAWADAWLGPEQGWLSIDITNRTRADGRYCRLAVGRDYLDACPVRGVRRGGGPEDLAVRVSVTTAASRTRPADQ